MAKEEYFRCVCWKGLRDSRHRNQCVTLSLSCQLVFSADLLSIVFWIMVEDLSPGYPPDVCTFFICHFSRDNKTSVYTNTPFWELKWASNPNSCHATRANSGHIPPCDVRGFKAKTHLEFEKLQILLPWNMFSSLDCICQNREVLDTIIQCVSCGSRTEDCNPTSGCFLARTCNNVFFFYPLCLHIKQWNNYEKKKNSFKWYL